MLVLLCLRAFARDFSPPRIPFSTTTLNSLHGHSCDPSDLSFRGTERLSITAPCVFLYRTRDTEMILFRCKRIVRQPPPLEYEFHEGRDQALLICHDVLSIWHITGAQ